MAIVFDAEPIVAYALDSVGADRIGDYLHDMCDDETVG